MVQENIILSKKVVARAWDYIKEDIEASDPDVAKKSVPFLSRLYHAINKTFAAMIKQLDKIKQKRQRRRKNLDKIERRDAKSKIELI